MTKRRSKRAGRRKAPIHPWTTSAWNVANERLIESLLDRGLVLRSARAKSEPWKHGIFELGKA